MYYKLICLCVLATCVYAAPAPEGGSAPEKQQPTVIPIVSQSDELEPNGTYKFSYETGNGIKREETSYDKVIPKAKGRSASSDEGGEDSDESDEIHVQEGSYSYTAPDGTLISVRYIADENGFRPIGDHIPRVPSATHDSGNSGEKSGRALKHADSSSAASAPAIVSRSAAGSEDKKAPPESKEAKQAPSTSVAPSEKGDESTPASSGSESTTAADAKTEAADEPSTESSSTPEASTTVASDASSTTSAQTDATEASSTTAADSSSTTTAAESSTTESSTAAESTPSDASSTSASDSASTTTSEPASEATNEASTTVSEGSTTEGTTTVAA